MTKVSYNNKQADDYNWETYYIRYGKQATKFSKLHTQILTNDNFEFVNGKISLKRGYLPLHDNHRLLYETICELDPETVMEFGCGWGDHIHNISKLKNTIRVCGVDIGIEQLKILCRRHPHLSECVKQLDITNEYLPIDNQYDIVYTQAVLMHLQTNNNHISALKNMFKLAKRQVLLIENFNCHDFYSDVKNFVRKDSNWNTSNIYFKALEKAKMMIISKEKLKYGLKEECR